LLEAAVDVDSTGYFKNNDDQDSLSSGRGQR
jgi:hypothetical protein